MNDELSASLKYYENKSQCTVCRNTTSYFWGVSPHPGITAISLMSCVHAQRIICLYGSIYPSSSVVYFWMSGLHSFPLDRVINVTSERLVWVTQMNN